MRALWDWNIFKLPFLTWFLYMDSKISSQNSRWIWKSYCMPELSKSIRIKLINIIQLDDTWQHSGLLHRVLSEWASTRGRLKLARSSEIHYSDIVGPLCSANSAVSQHFFHSRWSLPETRSQGEKGILLSTSLILWSASFLPQLLADSCWLFTLTAPVCHCINS